MALRRRMVFPTRGRAPLLRGPRPSTRTSRNRFSVHQRNFRTFGMGGGTSTGDFHLPPRKGDGTGKRGGGSANGGSRGPPRGRGFGSSASSPGEPNPHKLSPKAEAALRRKELIKRRWKRTGIAVALGSIPLLGWLFFRGPKSSPVEPVRPTTIDQNDPSRNGKRVPVEDFPSSNRRPIDMLPNETQREYDARKEAERRAEIERNKPPKTTRPSEKAEKFYSEKLSRQFTDQYVEFMKKVGQNVSEINWNKKVWPSEEKPLAEFVKNNHVIEVTRTLNVNGNETQQSMYIYIQKDPQTGDTMYFAHGPLTNSKEWKSGEYAQGTSNSNLESLLNYLGNPAVTGVYPPKK